jgi:hypothetical protein
MPTTGTAPGSASGANGTVVFPTGVFVALSVGFLGGTFFAIGLFYPCGKNIVELFVGLLDGRGVRRWRLHEYGIALRGQDLSDGLSNPLASPGLALVAQSLQLGGDYIRSQSTVHSQLPRCDPHLAALANSERHFGPDGAGSLQYSGYPYSQLAAVARNM